MKIEEEVELGIKRLYLPVVFKKECPVCKSEVELDLDQDCLSYPTINKVEDVGMTCNNCDTEFPMFIKLELSIEEV